MSGGVEAVEAYLAGVQEPHRSTLVAMRARLRKVLPDADEGMKYNMPSFIVDGHGVAAYCAFKHHCSYFPFSGSVIDKAGPYTVGTPTSKGTLQFPIDRPLPVAVVRRLVKVRVAEIAAKR